MCMVNVYMKSYLDEVYTNIIIGIMPINNYLISVYSTSIPFYWYRGLMAKMYKPYHGWANGYHVIMSHQLLLASVAQQHNDYHG